MLRNILLVLLVSVSLTATAQEKEVGQLDNLYKNGNYDKTIKKATKFAEVYPNRYEFPLYLSVSHWQYYKADKEASNLLLSLEELELAYRINGKKITKFAAEQKQLHNAALKLGPTLLKSNKKTEAKELYGYLATIYKDTTEEYTWLYPTPANAPHAPVATVTSIAPSKPEPTSSLTTHSSIVDQILAIGRSFLGMPYKYAGYDPATGFDCSGFVSYLFKQFNIDVPRSSSALAKVGTDIPLAQTRPGDLLFYGYKKNGAIRTSHVALVYSHNNGRLAFIHSSSRGVVIDDPSSSSWDYWEKRFLFAKRVLM